MHYKPRFSTKDFTETDAKWLMFYQKSRKSLLKAPKVCKLASKHLAVMVKLTCAMRRTKCASFRCAKKPAKRK